MDTYIQHDGKFYAFADTTGWEAVKDYPRIELANSSTPTDKPQFAPGYRVKFEDLKEWTEVEYSKNSCAGCAKFTVDSPAKCEYNCVPSERDDGKYIIFRKLTETTEPEKSPAQASAAILDNERNRIAYGFMQALLNDSSIYPENDMMNIYATAAFKYADAFIARAKQESDQRTGECLDCGKRFRISAKQEDK